MFECSSAKTIVNAGRAGTRNIYAILSIPPAFWKMEKYACILRLSQLVFSTITVVCVSKFFFPF